MLSKPSLRIRKLESELAVLKMPHYLLEYFPDGRVPDLSPGCQWHFFISKHEALGKQVAENITRALEGLGFKVWLSRDQEEVDEPGEDSLTALTSFSTGL